MISFIKRLFNPISDPAGELNLGSLESLPGFKNLEDSRKWMGEIPVKKVVRADTSVQRAWWVYRVWCMFTTLMFNITGYVHEGLVDFSAKLVLEKAVDKAVDLKEEVVRRKRAIFQIWGWKDVGYAAVVYLMVNINVELSLGNFANDYVAGGVHLWFGGKIWALILIAPWVFFKVRQYFFQCAEHALNLGEETLRGYALVLQVRSFLKLLMKACDACMIIERELYETYVNEVMRKEIDDYEEWKEEGGVLKFTSFTIKAMGILTIVSGGIGLAAPILAFTHLIDGTFRIVETWSENDSADIAGIGKRARDIFRRKPADIRPANVNVLRIAGAHHGVCYANLNETDGLRFWIDLASVVHGDHKHCWACTGKVWHSKKVAPGARMVVQALHSNLVQFSPFTDLREDREGGIFEEDIREQTELMTKNLLRTTARTWFGSRYVIIDPNMAPDELRLRYSRNLDGHAEEGAKRDWKSGFSFLYGKGKEVLSAAKVLHAQSKIVREIEYALLGTLVLMAFYQFIWKPKRAHKLASAVKEKLFGTTVVEEGGPGKKPIQMHPSLPPWAADDGLIYHVIVKKPDGEQYVNAYRNGELLRSEPLSEHPALQKSAGSGWQSCIGNYNPGNVEGPVDDKGKSPQAELAIVDRPKESINLKELVKDVPVLQDQYPMDKLVFSARALRLHLENAPGYAAEFVSEYPEARRCFWICKNLTASDTASERTADLIRQANAEAYAVETLTGLNFSQEEGPSALAVAVIAAIIAKIPDVILAWGVYTQQRQAKATEKMANETKRLVDAMLNKAREEYSSSDSARIDLLDKRLGAMSADLQEQVKQLIPAKPKVADAAVPLPKEATPTEVIVKNAKAKAKKLTDFIGVTPEKAKMVSMTLDNVTYKAESLDQLIRDKAKLLDHTLRITGADHKTYVIKMTTGVFPLIGEEGPAPCTDIADIAKEFQRRNIKLLDGSNGDVGNAQFVSFGKNEKGIKVPVHLTSHVRNVSYTNTLGSEMNASYEFNDVDIVWKDDKEAIYRSTIKDGIPMKKKLYSVPIKGKRSYVIMGCTHGKFCVVPCTGELGEDGVIRYDGNTDNTTCGSQIWDAAMKRFVGTHHYGNIKPGVNGADGITSSMVSFLC